MNIQYLLQRILSALLVIWGVSMMVFLLIQLVPGDPARIVLGAYASQEQVDGIRERMGLNEPILTPIPQNGPARRSAAISAPACSPPSRS